MTTAALLLRRALAQASLRTTSLNTPEELPGLLVAEGLWSAAEALEAIEGGHTFQHMGALVGLAPFLTEEEALGVLESAECDGDSFDWVRGLVAVARRLISLGAADQALEALSNLEPGPRGLAIARVIDELPAESRASAQRVALEDFELEGDQGGLACLMLARAVPKPRDPLVERGRHALWIGEESGSPHVLEWMMRMGYRERAVAFAREESGHARVDALAAVVPYCEGDERKALWGEWRAALEKMFADGWRLVRLSLPLPARDDELAELRALVDAQTAPLARAALLVRLAVHHPALADEALAAVRELAGLERALGLMSLLPALPEASRPALAREALPLLVSPEGRGLYELYERWPKPTEGPPLVRSPHTPTITGLRARAIAALAPDERRAGAQALLAAVLDIGDAHHRAGALGALAARLADPSARAAALRRAEAIAAASERPWIGFIHLIRRVEPEQREALVRRALAALPERIDEETAHALPPLLESLAPEEAGSLVARVFSQRSSGIVNYKQMIVAAALRAGAVRPIAELLLGEAGRDWARHLLPQVLRYAEGELRQRVVDALLEPFVDLWEHHFPDVDLVEAVPWFTPAERVWLTDRLPRQKVGSKFGNYREPLIVALARPLAEQGELDRLRPLLKSTDARDHLRGLASALPFLAEEARERVVRRLLADFRRQQSGLSYGALPHLAAAGYAAALLDACETVSAPGLASLAPHLPASLRPRLLELVTRAIRDGRGADTSAGLRELAPLLPELPREDLASMCERALEDAGERGRAHLFQRFITEDLEDEPETGLTLALVELAGASLPECIAELEGVAQP